jgi:CMP-N,N'-diacetyllegionaminic acid synthase
MEGEGVMRAAAVIPARGGSKGIPRKNIMDFCGKPLLAWTIEQAKATILATDVYVSTESHEIAEVARKYGAYVIDRPHELAMDDSTSEEALIHALDHIGDLDALVFLQATSPLRMHGDIDNAISKFTFDCADSLFSMSILADYCIWRDGVEGLESVNFDWKNRERRQYRMPSYLENGSIFVVKPEILVTTGNRLGGKIAMFEMEPWQSFEIDSPADVGIVEHYFRKHVLCDIGLNKGG